ncbi:hypothetical protein BD413DRAFT_264068 [Trametes elegans]|nr:hypothetical protein BD413DRAFT_264068 [Trametes elegans]
MTITTADTPNKALRHNSLFHTGQAVPEDKRDELHFMVTKKISAIPPAEFVRIFLEEATRTLDGADQAQSPSSHELPVNPFANLPAAKSEKGMYAEITKALNDSGLCPQHIFAATPHKGDTSEGSGQAIDLGMYPRHPPPNLGTPDKGNFLRTDWSTLEVGIECKMHSTAQDPFDESYISDEPDADSRREVLGQILAYLELIAHHQQRTFQYMVLFLGAFARILRVDQAGIFVTNKFKYRGDDGFILARFFRDLARLPLGCRGYDTTASRVSPDSAEGQQMQDLVQTITEDDYILKMFKDSLNTDWPWWKLEVPDETAGVDSTSGPTVANGERGPSRFYLVGKPYFQAPGTTGRVTRGYVALDVTNPGTSELVFLKDAWRVVSTDIEKEGVVLETLKQHKVKFIPTVLCHGDIPGQASLSQELWPKYHKGKKCELKAHQHYRLVVKEVCKPLDQFRNGSQLLLAIWCCLYAHGQAYKLGIIHRDISAGNILLFRAPNGRWHGMLNDWELSKTRAQQKEEGRQPDRTGTWQFLSVNALNNPRKTIVIQDELESFFHVLLYMAIRLLHHNFDDDDVRPFLRDYFDGCTPHSSGNSCGPVKANVMLFGCITVQPHRKDEEDGDVPVKELCFLWPDEDAPSDSSQKGKTDAAEVGPPQPTAQPPFPGSEGQSDASSSAPTQPRPQSPEKHHPLNDIFKTLLSWFSAYHTLRRPENLNPTARSVVQPPSNNDDALFFDSLEDSSDIIDLESNPLLDPQSDAGSESGTESEGSGRESTSPSDDSARAEKKARAALQKKAKKLRRHEDMLALLKEKIKASAWPQNDRRPDRKPSKRWKPAEKRIPKDSTLPMSLKRPASAVDDLEPPCTPPKRSRA